MTVLYDAAGQQCWITVTEEFSTRSLLLDGCEEGAMRLDSEEPVFAYLWFHKCSHLAPSPRPLLRGERGRGEGGSPIRRALVLGAGAFTAAKCLALDYPQADIDVVDLEPALEPVARRHLCQERDLGSSFRQCPSRLLGASGSLGTHVSESFGVSHGESRKRAQCPALGSNSRRRSHLAWREGKIGLGWTSCPGLSRGDNEQSFGAVE